MNLSVNSEDLAILNKAKIFPLTKGFSIRQIQNDNSIKEQIDFILYKRITTIKHFESKSYKDNNLENFILENSVRVYDGDRIAFNYTSSYEDCKKLSLALEKYCLSYYSY